MLGGPSKALKGEDGMIWNIHITICKTDNQCELDGWGRAPKSGALWQSEGIGCGGGWEGVQDGRDTWIPMADSTDVWQKSSRYCKVIILQLK